MMPAYPMNYKKSGSGRLIAVTVAVLAVLAGVILMIVGLVKTVQAGNDSKKKTEETTNIVTLEEIDVKENLEELGSITGEESVKQASLMTEEEAVKEFAMRGFTEEPIFIYCDMDGEYIGKTEISATGSQKHPSYETYYKTPSEGIWCIKLIGDTLYATPLSWYEDKSWSVPHAEADLILKTSRISMLMPIQSITTQGSIHVRIAERRSSRVIRKYRHSVCTAATLQ